MSLKTIIDAQGRKQNWIASQLEIPPSTFNAMIHDKARFPADKVESLAKVLGLPIKDILRAVSASEDTP